MATNPSIILGYRPADVPDPLETRLRQGQLQALAGQQQLQQQQLVGATMENQQRQIALDDQNKLRQAWQQSAGDGDKFFDLAAKSGTSPSALLQLKNSLIETKTKTAALGKADAENALALNTKIQSRLGPVAGITDPVKQAQAWADASASLVGDKTLTPEQAAQHPYPGSPDAVNHYVAGLNFEKWSLGQQQLATAGQRTAEGNAAAAKQTREEQNATISRIAAIADPGARDLEIRKQPAALAVQLLGKNQDELRALTMTGEQQSTSLETKRRDDRAATTADNANKISRARLGIAEQELALKKQDTANLQDPYNGLTPAMRAVADKIAFGDMGLSQLGRFPPKVREALTAAAVQRNPQWTAATFDTKQNFLNSAKPEGQALQGFGRLAEHIQRFEKNSGDIGYAPAYAMGVNLTGNQNKLNEDAHAIAAELEKRLAGGVGSEGQTRHWMAGLRSPDPSARQQAIDEIGQIAGAQLAQMNQAHKAAVGEDMPLDRYVTPATRDWLKRKNINVLGAAATPAGAPSAPGAPAPAPGAPPALGGMFNGEKVLKVTRVQ